MYTNSEHRHTREKKLRFRKKDYDLLKLCADHAGLEPAVYIRELVLEGLRLQLAANASLKGGRIQATARTPEARPA